MEAECTYPCRPHLPTTSNLTIRFNWPRRLITGGAPGLQGLREPNTKIGSLCLGHCVFYSGCDLFDSRHPSSTLDGKTKNICPLSEVDRFAEALSFTRAFCGATHRSRTGQAGRSLFDWHGPNRNRCNGVDHRRDIEAGHRGASV